MSVLARGRVLEMPRAPRGPRNPSQSQVGAVPRKNQQQHEELPHCPLCIEKFDATELSFKPCPCGYKICLFCYDRICKEFNNLCPGCRSPYGTKQSPARNGSRTPTPVKKRQNRQEDLPASGSSRPGCSSSHRNKSPSKSSAMWPSLAESMPASTSAPPQAKSKPVQNGFHQVNQKKSMDGNSVQHENKQSKSITALASKSSAGSESKDWPTLKSSTPATSKHCGAGDESAHLSMSESQGSTSEEAQRVRDTKTERKAFTAEVISTAGGRKKTVYVPIDLGSLPDTQTHPDGVASLGKTKKAVHEGKMSSSEGALRLVSVLQKIEKELGERPKAIELLQSLQPPEGRNEVEVSPMASGLCETSGQKMWASSLEHLNDTPSVVVKGPGITASPISPPMHQESLASMVDASPFTHGPIHPVDRIRANHQPSGNCGDSLHQHMYLSSVPQQHSVWTDQGLPGIELQARQCFNLNNTGLSQQMCIPGLSMGHDLFSPPQLHVGSSLGHQPSPLGPQGLLGSDMVYAYQQQQDDQRQQQNRSIPIPNQQELHKSSIESLLGHREPQQNGYGMPGMQYGGNAQQSMMPNGHSMMLDNLSNMAGSPSMWLGGHGSDVPQYLPPDIAAARNLNGMSQAVGSMQLPSGFQAYAGQSLEQQVATMRFQEQAQVQPRRVSRLVQNWK